MTQSVVDRWEWCIQACTHGPNIAIQRSSNINWDTSTISRPSPSSTKESNRFLVRNDGIIVILNPIQPMFFVVHGRTGPKIRSSKIQCFIIIFPISIAIFRGALCPIFQDQIWPTTRCSNRLLFGAVSGSKPEGWGVSIASPESWHHGMGMGENPGPSNLDFSYEMT